MIFWHAFAATFALVFLAELGDKTQLAVLLLAAGERPVWAVFSGAAAALVASALVAVFLGTSLSRYMPEVYIQKGAGALFIAIGILLLWGRF